MCTKPYKCYGIQWITHKLQAVQIALHNSQALEIDGIEGEVKCWCNARYPIHLAIYPDTLMPLKVLSLGFQTENHNPVT